MNTTSLFVELVVIGVGVLLWLLLLAGAVFGYAWVDFDQALLIASALPALAVIYVLGIIWDRVADMLFESLWMNELRDGYFDTKAEYYEARRLVINKSEALAELFEYGRSRMRICRGWTLNAVLIAVSLNLLLWIRYSDNDQTLPLSLFGTIVCLMVAVGARFAWIRLVTTEHCKISEQAESIRSTGQSSV